MAEAIAAGQFTTDARVLGIAFDGTGAGTDGTIWGGEFLLPALAALSAPHICAPGRSPVGGLRARRPPQRLLFCSVSSACSSTQVPLGF